MCQAYLEFVTENLDLMHISGTLNPQHELLRPGAESAPNACCLRVP